MINLPEQHTNVLQNWASVSRTLTEASRLLDDLSDLISGTYKGNQMTLQERAEACREELNTIRTPLDLLHREWRDQKWAERAQEREGEGKK